LSDKPRNEWAEQDYWVSVYDHVKGEWREVNILEMSEDDFRKWICWILSKMGVQMKASVEVKEKTTKILSGFHVIPKKTMENMKGLPAELPFTVLRNGSPIYASWLPYPPCTVTFNIPILFYDGDEICVKVECEFQDFDIKIMSDLIPDDFRWEEASAE